MSAAGLVNPPALGRPSGFSHGVLTPAGGRLLFVAGQTAATGDGRITTPDLVSQFDRALTHVLAVVREAGGSASHVARMTVYVVNMEAYRRSRPALGAVWQAQMGRHYPAMSVVEVRALVLPEALVELEATAVLP